MNPAQAVLQGTKHAVLTKCANPSCSAPFLYLREGKLFVMEQPPGPELVDATSPCRRVEHFWLCGACSRLMTLVFDRETGVHVLPKNHKAIRAVG